MDTKYANLTPLNTLAKKVKAENFERVFDCIRQLVNFGANPNMPDDRDMTPILYIIKNEELDDCEKLRIVEFLLSNAKIDLDTYCDGEGRQLISKMFPEITLPNEVYPTEIDTLLTYLRNENQKKFLEAFGHCKNLSSSEITKLLMKAIRHGQNEALDKILETNPDINAIDIIERQNILTMDPDINGGRAITMAVYHGNDYALEKLLENDSLNLKGMTLLCSIIKNCGDGDNYDYEKCFYILVNSPKIDLNEPDRSGCTPLYYATYYKNEKFARELLKRGAYIGAKEENPTPITQMDPELLEEYMDNCISTSGEKEDLKIMIDFKHLIPPKNGKEVTEEMNPLNDIANSKEHLHLLNHPLLTTFLFLKWHRMSFLFYMNFIIYGIFSLNLLVFIIIEFNKNKGALPEGPSVITGITHVITGIGWIYLVLRETVQFISSPCAYLRSSCNILEIALILFTLNALLLPFELVEYTKDTQRILSVVTILLMAIELCFLMLTLPFLTISTHMLMLYKVTVEFIKSFSLYSIFIIMFSLCFYVLLSEKPGEEDGGNLDKFESPLFAIMRTVLMMTGEFDAGNLKFDTFGYIVFLCFILFMSICLLNLLTGLAVSDTQVTICA